MDTGLSRLDDGGRFNSDVVSAWKCHDWSEELNTNAGMHGVIPLIFKEPNHPAALTSKPAPFLDVADKIPAAASILYAREPGLFINGTKSQISLVSQACLALAGAIN